MRLQKLYDVVIPKKGETSAPNAEKRASAFSEWIQCLDDRISLVIREANNDGRGALKVLREHYQGKEKSLYLFFFFLFLLSLYLIIALYTELTSLHMVKARQPQIISLGRTQLQLLLKQLGRL